MHNTKCSVKLNVILKELLLDSYDGGVVYCYNKKQLIRRNNGNAAPNPADYT